MVQVITLQHTLLQCKAELDQFIEGLKALGVLSAIREHPNILRPFFSQTAKKLSSGNNPLAVQQSCISHFV